MPYQFNDKIKTESVKIDLVKMIIASVTSLKKWTKKERKKEKIQNLDLKLTCDWFTDEQDLIIDWDETVNAINGKIKWRAQTMKETVTVDNAVFLMWAIAIFCFIKHTNAQMFVSDGKRRGG